MVGQFVLAPVPVLGVVRTQLAISGAAANVKFDCINAEAGLPTPMRGAELGAVSQSASLCRSFLLLIIRASAIFEVVFWDELPRFDQISSDHSIS